MEKDSSYKREKSLSAMVRLLLCDVEDIDLILPLFKVGL